jgi:FMN-dependent NADH-azoreductase
VREKELMDRLLHVLAAPRGEDSRTLKVAGAFLERFREKCPGCQVDELDVFTDPLPALTLEVLGGKYVLLGGGELSGELKDAWRDIEREIERFLSADGYLISTPMWNFSIPFALKHYIDVIVQPGYLFRNTEQGVEGLVKGKKMVIITSRGSDYSPDGPSHAYDHQEPYLRTVFGFVGITDITFVNAQPMDAMGPEVAREKLEVAQRKAVEIAAGF